MTWSQEVVRTAAHPRQEGKSGRALQVQAHRKDTQGQCQAQAASQVGLES